MIHRPRYRVFVKPTLEKEYYILIERQKKPKQRYEIIVIGERSKSALIAMELAVKAWKIIGNNPYIGSQ